MKLCFVTHQFKTGGVERIFCAIAKELDNDSVSLLCATPYEDEMIKNIPPNVKRINLYEKFPFKFLKAGILNNTKLSSLFRAISLFLAVLYIRLSPKYKEYTFVNFSDTISTLILSYYGSHKRKVFSWLHFNPKTLYKSHIKFLYDFIYRRFYRIICICEEQRDLMLKVVKGLNPDNLVVIYNLLDYNQITKQSEEALSFTDKYILMVARFDYRSKDFKTIIEAYTYLPEDLRKKYKLVFVGDGPDMKDVQTSILNIRDYENIVFVGKQANPYKWIKNATILVHSSKSEGLPTVLLESLACGTPVISTKCETGPSEILAHGKAGILVEVGNETQMSSAICELLESESLRESFVNEGTKQLKLFSKSSIVKKINSLWNN